MSHAVVIVNVGTGVDPTNIGAINTLVEDLMAPYDEGKVVPQYRDYHDRGEKARLIHTISKQYKGSNGHVYEPTLDVRFGEWPKSPHQTLTQGEKDKLSEAEWKVLWEQYEEAERAIGDLYTDREVVNAYNQYWGREQGDEDDRYYVSEIMPTGTNRRGLVSDTGIYTLTTYNPLSKWDWYQIGGRWRGYFTLRANANDPLVIGEPGVPESMDQSAANRAKREREMTEGLQTDIARVGSIDFEAMRERRLEEIRGYSQDAWDRRKSETPEQYIERSMLKYTGLGYAVLDADGWHENGRMGWFGMDNLDAKHTPEEWAAAVENYRLNLDPETVLVAVDYHI